MFVAMDYYADAAWDYVEREKWELAVISFANGSPTLLETAPGVSVQDVLAATEARLAVPDQVPQMQIEGALS